MDRENHLPVGVAFIAPSITPLVYVYEGVNPSFRAYDYDHINKEILSYKQYYLPLNEVINDENDEYDNDMDDPALVRSDRRRLNSKMLSKRQVEERDNNELPPIETEENITTTETILENITDTTTEPSETTLQTEPSSKTEEIEPIETTTKMETPSDAEILSKYWQFAYNAALNYDIASMNTKNMYKIYSNMKSTPQGTEFKYYWRHAFVLRSMNEEECNKTCIADVICTLTNFVHEDFIDCIEEQDVHKVSTTISTTTTRTSTTTNRWTAGKSSTEKQKVWTRKTTTTKSPRQEIGIQPSVPEQHNVARGIAIGLVLVALVALAVFGVIMYQRMKRRRYSSQEFLLDSFRYDGYSQIDQP